MITYTIKHHVPGRIRIEIPGIKKMDLDSLIRLSEAVTRRWRIAGIRDFSANPLTGSATITYDPSAINILAYLSAVAADEEIEHAIKKGVLHEVR